MGNTSGGTHGGGNHGSSGSQQPDPPRVPKPEDYIDYSQMPEFVPPSDWDTTGKHITKEQQMAELEAEHKFNWENQWLRDNGYADRATQRGDFQRGRRWDAETSRWNKWVVTINPEKEREQVADDTRVILNASNTKKKVADVKVGDSADEEGTAKAGETGDGDRDPSVKRKKAAGKMLGFK